MLNIHWFNKLPNITRYNFLLIVFSSTLFPQNMFQIYQRNMLWGNSYPQLWNSYIELTIIKKATKKKKKRSNQNLILRLPLHKEEEKYFLVFYKFLWCNHEKRRRNLHRLKLIQIAKSRSSNTWSESNWCSNSSSNQILKFQFMHEKVE